MANNAIQIFDGTPTEVIAQTANIADGEVVGGDAVFDNTTDLWPMATATLFVTGFGTAPTGTIDLYCMKGNVGSGSEDEDAGGIAYSTTLTTTDNETQTSGLHYLGSFSFDDADTGNARQAITISLMGVKEAYFYIDNNSGYELTQPVTVDIEGFTFTPST